MELIKSEVFQGSASSAQNAEGFDTDLFVIGGGSGGVRAARIAAGHGARVMLAEEHRVGGTCVIRGCVPKKLLVYASRFAHDFRDAEGFGWTVPTPHFDWNSLITNKDAEIDRLENVYQSNLEKTKVEILRSRAVVEGAHEVRVVKTGRLVRARFILIAVGANPSTLPVPGGDLAITSNEAFYLTKRPDHVLIVGGGYISVEFAGIFAGLGSRVTLVHRGDKLLRGFDHAIQDRLGDTYRKRGIEVLLGRKVEDIRKVGGFLEVRLSDGTIRRVDEVMAATGRKPHTKGLGLEGAGIVPDDDGAIPVNDHCQTKVPSIYAVGDVTNHPHLTPVAIREGHAVADTLFGGRPTPIVHELIPTAVFSTPEIGTVGLTEAAARHQYGHVTIFQATFRDMKATLSGSEERTFMKLITHPSTDKVLGVHIVGHEAAELIQLVGVAMTMGATKADFDRTMAVHPTAAEELVTMRTPSN
ncbi:glutathione-disulfide reductase [Bradyrhizobium diazoefficiens]|nr:glutathione-disulfide reductase [Bradyrhizobium diazoefficiens]QQN62313.1 glutathione-disulfide reductase [Bradyrhizobium diazoefficiens]